MYTGIGTVGIRIGTIFSIQTRFSSVLEMVESPYNAISRAKDVLIVMQY